MATTNVSIRMDTELKAQADELREILLTVKGIGPAKAENIMEAVGKALAEKG